MTSVPEYFGAGGAALAAGVINALAGGGTLVSFPVLVALGVPSVNANITNTVSLCPGYLGGAAAQRSELREHATQLRSMALVAAVGSLTGSVLLVVLIKVVVAFAVLLVAVMLYIWAMRKVIADMQNRIGPNRAGPYGVLQTLADGIKLFFKEGIVPSSAERFVFLLAPVLAMVPPFLAFAVIPFGAPVTLFGRTVPLQIADLDVGILWVLAMGSLGVYGVVLAGWSSGSNYPLLGSVRSSAQMISYEVGMGLALVAVLMYTGSLRMSEIVASQERLWNVIPQFPAFVAYLIAGLAETNRPPFDLAEAESELVAGFHTEYSGIAFAMFFLGEYVATVTVAAIATTLFLGGWNGPAPSFLPWLWPIAWFLVKEIGRAHV